MTKEALAFNLVQTSSFSQKSTVKLNPTLNEKRKISTHLCVFLFRSANIVCINYMSVDFLDCKTEILRYSFLCLTQDVCSYLWDIILKIKSPTEV